jgi:hypothetical protein
MFVYKEIIHDEDQLFFFKRSGTIPFVSMVTKKEVLRWSTAFHLKDVIHITEAFYKIQVIHEKPILYVNELLKEAQSLLNLKKQTVFHNNEYLVIKNSSD